MPTKDTRRARIVKIASALPKAEAEQTGPLRQHISFRVRGKAFAYYVVNEHDDGRVAIICKAAPGEQSRLVASDSKRYYLPKYMAHHGWVGLDLDAGKLDWDEVARFVTGSYRLIAPKRLAALVAG